MKVTPLVSVVIPAYNASKYISDAIDSVRRQSYDNLEILVVNDGSTDNTSSIVKELAKQDKRIIYLEQPNGKQGKARNLAIKKSQGELIALLDADDLWKHDKIEKQVNALNENNAGFVFSDAEMLMVESKRGNEKFGKSNGLAVEGVITGAEMFNLLVESNRIMTLTACFRKSILDKTGMFAEDPEFQNCEDYELWIRMAHSGTVFFGLNEKLAIYRVHEGGVTINIENQLKPEIRIFEKLYREKIISGDQKRKALMWLYRVLISGYVKSNKMSAIRPIWSDPLLPKPPASVFTFLFLAYTDKFRSYLKNCFVFFRKG